jgi:hypothetical protein
MENIGFGPILTVEGTTIWVSLYIFKLINFFLTTSLILFDVSFDINWFQSTLDPSYGRPNRDPPYHVQHQ